MSLKSVLTAAVLTLVPLASTAECFGDHSQQAMSCAEGNVWDADKAACVPVVTG